MIGPHVPETTVPALGTTTAVRPEAQLTPRFGPGFRSRPAPRVSGPSWGEFRSQQAANTLACVIALDTLALRRFFTATRITPESATGDAAVEAVVSGWLVARFGP